jgi:hypothetical protein
VAGRSCRHPGIDIVAPVNIVGAASGPMPQASAARSRSLAQLIERCHGDERPECPSLEALADGRSAELASARLPHRKMAAASTG